MTSGGSTSYIQVGQPQLIDAETAHCSVRWSHSSLPGMSCAFAVRIKTFSGESWVSRKAKAIAEAQRFAEAFLAASVVTSHSDIASAA